MRYRRLFHSRNNTLQRGFTLAETTVVLTIAGMMVTVALPRMDSSRWKADAVAQIVRTGLQTASRTSITRQHDIIVSFDLSAQRIRTVWDANNDGQVGTTERVAYRGLDTGVLFADPNVNGVSGAAIMSPINGAAIVTRDGMPTITFHRDGSVSSDAEIYVAVAARGPTLHRALVLTQATGRVDWYRLNATTKKWVIAGL